MSVNFGWLIRTMYFYLNKNTNREKNLWIFGCWGGNKYSDNSKALYEYILDNHRNISAVWITKSHAIYNKLTSMKKPCFLVGTAEAKRAMQRAGVAFYTNSIEDFGDIDYLNGALKVALFHGVGFKLELREFNVNKSFIGTKLRELKHKIYCDSFADLICTTSSFMRYKFARQQYNCDILKIEVTGQPRNDIFQKLDTELNREKVIMYLPTFREDKDSQEKLQYVINELVNSDVLEKLLSQNNFKFVVKPHYLTKVKMNKKRDHIFIYNDTDLPDVQKALADTDILITDYSSVASDFALLNRPIIFYDFDLRNYMPLLADEYIEVLREGYVKSSAELLSLLAEIFDGKVDLRPVNKIINYYCNSPELKIGTFCENVYRAVKKKIDKKYCVK